MKTWILAVVAGLALLLYFVLRKKPAAIAAAPTVGMGPAVPNPQDLPPPGPTTPTYQSTIGSSGFTSASITGAAEGFSALATGNGLDGLATSIVAAATSPWSNVQDQSAANLATATPADQSKYPNWYTLADGSWVNPVDQITYGPNSSPPAAYNPTRDPTSQDYVAPVTISIPALPPTPPTPAAYGPGSANYTVF